MNNQNTNLSILKMGDNKSLCSSMPSFNISWQASWISLLWRSCKEACAMKV